MKGLTTIACALMATVTLAYGGQDPWRERSRITSPLALALDANLDGVLSASEIQAAAPALRQLDTNGDGAVAAVELRAAGLRNQQGGRDQSAGDAGRSRGEGAGSGAPAVSTDDLTQTLMGFDRDGDGRLVRSELPARFHGMFDRADADKDDALTHDEVRQSATASVEARPNGEGRVRGERGSSRSRGQSADPVALAPRSNGLLRPVVIGGIITSTLLTLIVLPTLYEIVEARWSRQRDE